MPWKLESAKGGYYVTNIATGKRMSRRPLPRVRAASQMRALYANNPEAVKEILDLADQMITLKRIGRRADVSKSDKKRAVGKYGDVTYADPINKKYPIDTPAHIRAAWSYSHMPKNIGKYSGSGGVDALQNTIRAAYEREFGHPPNAKNIRPRRRKEITLKRGRGNMPGLAKHLAHKYGGDPHFFTKVVEDELLQGYDEEARNAIAARAHKLVVGHWPAEDKKFEKKKEASPTIRNMLEGKIHRAFTVTADMLFQRGYIDRDTRIALSGLIGDVLSEFGERFETTGLDGPISGKDALDISDKEVSAQPTGIPAHGPGGTFSSPGLGGGIAPAKRKLLAPSKRGRKWGTTIKEVREQEEAARPVKKQRRADRKEITTLRELRRELYAAQFREYSRLKEGDDSALDRLRALRLESRDLELDLAGGHRPAAEDDWTDEFKEVDAIKGGPGSGNFGHAGRSGKIGGSAPKSGEGAALSLRTGRDAAERQLQRAGFTREMLRQAKMRHVSEIQSAIRLSKEVAADMVRQARERRAAGDIPGTLSAMLNAQRARQDVKNWQRAMKVALPDAPKKPRLQVFDAKTGQTSDQPFVKAQADFTRNKKTVTIYEHEGDQYSVSGGRIGKRAMLVQGTDLMRRVVDRATQ